MPTLDEEQVRAIIAKKLEVDMAQVVPNAKFVDDLKADSLAMTELSMELEDQFGITIPAEQEKTIKTVDDLMAILRTTPHSD